MLNNVAVSSSNLVNAVLSPFPSRFVGTLTLAPPDSTQLLSKATIQVVQQAAGAGQVSITATDDGVLTWLDSNYGEAGAAWPGTYQLRATLAGYAPATATVECLLGKACTWDGLQLQQLGTLVVQAAAGAPGNSTPINGATFTLSGNGSTAADPDGCARQQPGHLRRADSVEGVPGSGAGGRVRLRRHGHPDRLAAPTVPTPIRLRWGRVSRPRAPSS